MKHFQDTETGEIYAFEDGVNPHALGWRNIPKTLNEKVIPKPDEAHVWLNGDWVKKSDAPEGYKPPVSSVPVFNPAWISFITPYTFIYPDEELPLEITLDQINSNSYDNEKLCSTVGALRLENSSGTNLLISYDGAISIPRDDVHPNEEAAVGRFNQILCAILLGGIHVEAMSLRDLACGSLSNGSIFSNTPTKNGQYRHKAASITELVHLLNARKLSLPSLGAAYQHGMSILDEIRNLSPSFLIHGYTAMVHHHRAEALSNIWIVVEQLTAFLWEHRFIKNPEHHPKNMKKRMNSFKNDSRTWSIAVRQELLWQIGVISDEKYAALYLARQKRNLLVHSGGTPDFSTIHDLWGAIAELLQVASGVPPKISAPFPKYEFENRRTVNFEEWDQLAGSLPNLAEKQSKTC